MQHMSSVEKPSQRPDAALRTLRAVAWAEGVSFLLLLFVAMPLKYFWDQPLLVRILGPIHGLLFLYFLWELFATRVTHNWSWSKVALALVLSLVPGGPFFFEWSQKGEGGEATR